MKKKGQGDVMVHLHGLCEFSVCRHDFWTFSLCVQLQLLLRYRFLNINNREVECSLDSYHVKCNYFHQVTQLTKCV